MIDKQIFLADARFLLYSKKTSHGDLRGVAGLFGCFWFFPLSFFPFHRLGPKLSDFPKQISSLL